MAYFEPFIDVEGIHIPSYNDILEYLIERYRAIFGADAYLGEETPDYQLLSVFAKCLDDYSALAVDVYNARNPLYASGNSLDILVELAGIIRNPATYSTSVLTLTGNEGTQIDAGKKVVDDSGNTWSIDSTVTIPNTGTITVGATCDTIGAVVAPAGTINGIYNPVSGWTSVTNEEAATTGLNVESDADLRARFEKSHAASVSGLMESVISGLLRVDGVTFADVIQNDTGSTDARGIPAHSICSLVVGGNDEDVAEAIYRLKAPGVGTYGSTTETVTDDQGRTNTVKFTRPTTVTVTVNIALTKLPGYDDDRIEYLIQNAIAEDISSLGIGAGWNVTMAYKDIYSAFPDDIPFVITSLSATNTHGTSTSAMECYYNEILVTDAEHIVITAT